MVNAAENGISKDIQPVYITNSNLKIEEMSKILEQAGDCYIICNFNSDITAIKYQPAAGMTREECLNKINQINKKADEIINKIIKPGMNDFEKELAIHDYIVANTKYDERFFSGEDKVPYDSRTPYGALFKGTEICGGYASTMKLLLNKVGIECWEVSGQENGVNHMWNIVNINGEYYHLDATLDDPVPDVKNRVIHSYFNISDDIISLNHTWDKDYYPKCTNKKYDNYDWSALNKND